MEGYSVFFVPNPETTLKPPTMRKMTIGGKNYYDFKRYEREKKFFYGNNPEQVICYNLNFNDQNLFFEANEMCNQNYVAYGLIDEGEEFEENPDIFCVVLLNKKIVGTLGYIYRSELPIRKTYKNLRIEPNAQEIVRMAIHPDAGFRTEVMPVKIVQMRKEEHLWKNQKYVKKVGDEYHKLVRVTDEVGQLLFANMLSYYKSMASACYNGTPPSVWISTHQFVKRFFDNLLNVSIFEVNQAEINWTGIPKKSHVAYKQLEFQPMRIRLERLLPELFQKPHEQPVWNWEKIRRRFPILQLQPQ